MQNPFARLFGCGEQDADRFLRIERLLVEIRHQLQHINHLLQHIEENTDRPVPVPFRMAVRYSPAEKEPLD